MKLKKLLFIAPLFLSLGVLTGCGEDEPEYDVDPTVVSGYYKDFDFDAEGPFMEAALQELMFKKHTNYVKYSAFNGYCQDKSNYPSVENVPGSPGVNQYFYTGKEASSYGTREHVWPCANSAALWVHDKTAGSHYVDGTGYAGGGSDLFHVRTAATNVNTARGNSKFVDFDDPEFESIRGGVYEYTENKGKWPLKIQGYEVTSTGTKQYAQKCEPDDHMKGDIARIIAYVYIHYTDRGVTPEGYPKIAGKTQKTIKYSDMVGTLALTNIFGYDSISRCAEKLIEWNKLDKPSAVEKQRNDTVQKIQGNRNPFVDYPELMDKAFGSLVG